MLFVGGELERTGFWDTGDGGKEILVVVFLQRIRVSGVGVFWWELCHTVVEIRRVSDRMMAIVLVYEENVLRLICGYAPQS